MNRKEVLEYAGYLLVASIMVLIVVAVLSQVMPTAKDYEPGAKVLLEMSGRL